MLSRNKYLAMKNQEHDNWLRNRLVSLLNQQDQAHLHQSGDHFGKSRGRRNLPLLFPSLRGGRHASPLGKYLRIIGRQWLRDNVGLSEKQVDAFFNNDITVRVSVRVRAALLEYGSIYVGVLIQGY
jgi:hypothetical protein